MNRHSLGPLVKALETLKVFARSAPSPRELLANRRGRFVSNPLRVRQASADRHPGMAWVEPA